jgi:hypothetical protein
MEDLHLHGPSGRPARNVLQRVYFGWIAAPMTLAAMLIQNKLWVKLLNHLFGLALMSKKFLCRKPAKEFES